MVQQVGWKEVQDLLPGLDEQPDVDFPGVAGLAADLRTVEASTQTNHGVPPVDIGQLLDHVSVGRKELNLPVLAPVRGHDLSWMMR